MKNVVDKLMVIKLLSKEHKQQLQQVMFLDHLFGIEAADATSLILVTTLDLTGAP